MVKARVMGISIWASALLALSPSTSAASFAQAHMYSNLQWSPDGTKIFYEDRFIEDPEAQEGYEYLLDSAVPEICCVDLATGEAAGVVPGGIYINPAVTPGPIKIEKLYGFELCSAEEGLSREAYSVAAIERARDALYISGDFSRFVFEELQRNYGPYDLVWEDARAGLRRVLAEEADGGSVYLKKKHGLVYTLGEESGSGRQISVTYLLDLKTGYKRRLGSFDLLALTADESRAAGLRYVGESLGDDYWSVMSMSLATDEAEPEELFKDRFYWYAPSQSGNKIAYLYEGRGRSSPRYHRVWAADLTTGERVGLVKGWLTYEAWSPDGRYLVFKLSSDNPFFPAVFVVDTDARKLAAYFKSLNVDFFSWSPSAKYVAFGTNDPPENLRVIDVETGEGWTAEVDEATFFCWAGASRFFYSSGGKLYSYDCENREGKAVYTWFSEGYYEVLTWISDSQLIFMRGSKEYMEYGYGGLHLLDVRTGAHRVLAPGTGCDFSFDEDGNLVFRTDGMAPGYPEYWKLDSTTGYVAPYEGPLEDVARRSSGRAARGVFPSPDGGRVAVLEGGKLTLRDADGSNVVTLMERGKGINVLKYGEADPRGPVWSPAGDKITWLREGRGCLPDDYFAGPFADIWVANRDGSDAHIVVESDTGSTPAPRGYRKL